MTPFHPQQSNRGRRVRKNANANTFNFTSQIAPPICAAMHTEHDKSDATIFKPLCSRTVVCYRLYRVSGKEAALLPLPPLRTGRESFPSSGSSRSKAPYYGAGELDGF